MASITILYTALLLWVTAVAASKEFRESKPVQHSPKLPIHGQSTPQGCFASLPRDASPSNKMTFNCPTTCSRYCVARGKPVGIVRSNMCFCAESYPPRSSMLPEDRCYLACPGYDRLACGGTEAYTVYNVGLENDVKFDDEEEYTSVEIEVGEDEEEYVWVESEVGDDEAVHEITKGDGTLLSKVGDFFNRCVSRLGWGQTAGKENKDL